MFTAVEIFAVFTFLVVESGCQEIVSCGKIKSPPETIVKGSEKITPWTAFLVDKTHTTNFAGILVSPNLVFLQAHYFYNDKSQQLQISRLHSHYEVIVGSSEFSNETTQGQRIPVSFISIHPKFSRTSQWTDTNYDFALAHLSSPVQITEAVQPVCIPSFREKNEMEDSIEPKPLFVFGWPKNHTYLYNGFQLETLNRTDCTKIWKRRLTPGHRHNIYCAVVSQANDEGYCANRDIGSFYISNGSYYFLGQVLQFFSKNGRCTKGSEFLIWSLTDDTLQWIQNSDKCGSNKFTCFNDGSCIEKQKMCDGNVDCIDASDEQTQYCTNHQSCGVEDLKCRVYGSCVPLAKINDGIADCPYEEDEEKEKFIQEIFTLLLFLGISVGLIIVLIGIAGFNYFRLKVRRLKAHIRNLTQDEVDEFLTGYHDPQNPDTIQVKSSRTVEEYCQLYINRRILSNPWREEHEVPMKRIEIGKELNRGNFGVVHKGRLQLNSSQSKYSDVAVKTYVSNVSVEEFKNLLREVKILAHVGAHQNIVSFLGACTGDIKKRKLYLLIELCELGDLLNYLKSHAKNCVEDLEGIDLEHNLPGPISKDLNLATTELLKWCSQIASGMDYLESKSVIHGDLALRNILLSNTFDAKISDFGLARELNNSEIYVKSPGELLPWRWLALESFTGRVYSHKTDVWAYGVTLWEIFSMGQTPYGKTHFNSDFVMKLQTGTRLSCPLFASLRIYDVLLKTWSENSDSRPTFKELEFAMSSIRNNACCDEFMVSNGILFE